MLNSADVYLGTFLVLCGFSLSLLNLRRVIQKNDFSSVLLSENILLMCIGIAFVVRAVYKTSIVNIHMYEMDERSINIVTSQEEGSTKQCTIWSVILSYGPVVMSFVNSFVSLVIDNYLHYTMLSDIKDIDEENTVQDISQRSFTSKIVGTKKFTIFWKKYFSYIAVGLQWIIPILVGLLMYPMGVNERNLGKEELFSDTCLAMIALQNKTSFEPINYTTLDFRKYIKPTANYLEANDINSNVSHEISSVVNNLHKIINDIQNNSLYDVNLSSAPIYRQPKYKENYIKVCYVDNNRLIVFMFVLAVISYFVPITISTIILTNIHVINTSKPNVKTYVSRELLYNILFWTPVMFDTFLSLVLCSYAMNGMKTSILNVVANVYQVVKNFLNTKYFKDNIITPI